MRGDEFYHCSKWDRSTGQLVMIEYPCRAGQRELMVYRCRHEQQNKDVWCAAYARGEGFIDLLSCGLRPSEPQVIVESGELVFGDDGLVAPPSRHGRD